MPIAAHRNWHRNFLPLPPVQTMDTDSYFRQAPKKTT
jgi:hypothetical protein